MIPMDPDSSGHYLKNKGVLVTRPLKQAEPLCHLIEEHGGRALRFPVLEILDLPDAHLLGRFYKRLTEFDLGIFVSANAVYKTAEWILAERHWPTQVQIAAIGPSSVSELEKLGLAAHLVPEKIFNSEGLLELEELNDVTKKKIAIFRGKGGRSLLGDTLKNRGAVVEYFEVYHRAVPRGDIQQLIASFEAGEIDVITVSSLESLRNLINMVGDMGQPWLRKTPIVVINEEMKKRVQGLGGSAKLLAAENATDQAILEALLAWSRSGG